MKINRLTELFLSPRRLLKPWKFSLTSLVLTVGLATNTSTLATTVAQRQEQTIDFSIATIAEAAYGAITAQIPTPSVSIPDGTYLYGQSPQPEQIGQEYLVFEAHQGKVIGAVYMPSSEYSCFYGTMDSTQLNLTVTNPYDQTAFSHTIARELPAQVAAAGGQLNLENTFDSVRYPHTVGLEGYEPIGEISDNDRQILNSCIADYKDEVWN